MKNSTINMDEIIQFIQGDLRKIKTFAELSIKYPQNLFQMMHFFQYKSYNEDTKKTTKQLFTNQYHIDDHNKIINDTDRTSIGLLWHENVVDIFTKFPIYKSIPIYLEQLNNICFADNIDRITFQKQIWEFNELSSLIKTMKNNKLLFQRLQHESLHFPWNPLSKDNSNPESPLKEIRFTKVLTKYSTEYNNMIFIQKLCQQLSMDKKDLFGFFYMNQIDYSLQSKKNSKTSSHVWANNSIFEITDIKKLDIQRINRYLNIFTHYTLTGYSDDDDNPINDIDNSDDGDDPTNDIDNSDNSDDYDLL
jgi:hypothetical protein